MTIEIEEIEYKIYTPPKTVGTYYIGDSFSAFHIALTKKPSLFHRYFMKLFLGFKWEDFKEQK